VMVGGNINRTRGILSVQRGGGGIHLRGFIR
jgi:hypothetical protein